jgi:hypothetical protein
MVTTGIESETLLLFSEIKNSDENYEIRGCFIDPSDSDERTDGEMGIRVFSA